MVKITNIKIDENIVSCNYYPEDGDKYGFISYDMENDKYIDRICSDEGKNEDMYIGHAIHKVIQIVQEKKEIPKEAYSVWY